MKKFLMGTVGLVALGLAAPASAADLAARPYNKAPVYAPAPVMSWTGFYIGAHIGGAWRGDETFGVAGWTGNNNDGRFMGGGQVGADYQFAPNWLVGIEANISALGNNNETFVAPGFIASRKNDYVGSVTGRLGYVFGPALLYAKGGLGFTDTKYSLTNGAGVPVAFVSSKSDTGYTVGAGLEYMFAPSWSAKVEYQYFNFDKGQQFISAAAGLPLGVNLNNDIHTVKLGVNYHFNVGGPVVAKY